MDQPSPILDTSRDTSAADGAPTRIAAARPIEPRRDAMSHDVPTGTTVCIDLDRGIISTDVLIELTLRLLKRRPLVLLMLPLWLWRGRAYTLGEIARHEPVDAAALPYHPAARAALDRLRAAGERIVAVSRLDAAWAEPIARHLGISHVVSGSRPGLARRARLDATFGPGQWRLATLLPASDGATPESWIARLRPYLKAMRPHQWMKNLLVFVPIVLAMKSLGTSALVAGAVAFVAFGFAASSVYLLNDLTDLGDDRRHPTKCRRPIAAGLVAPAHALALVPVLLGLAVGLSLLLLPPFFTVVLLAYYALTVGYSFALKRMMLVDVITLAALYTLRIIAGSAAVAIPRSFWLLAFSIFLFFSLALVKRYIELKDAVGRLESNGAPVLGAKERLRGRGYRAVDLETLSQFGISSGMMAVLVFALYIDSPVVKSLYTRPELIWLLCPILLYLICRFWILARRGEMHDDPIVFAARDWRSQIVVAIAGVLLLVAALL